MLFILIARFLLVASATTSCDADAWSSAFAFYQREHPKAEATDLYKFAHQGIMGSEHAVSDTASVAAWMGRELAALGRHPEPVGHHAPLAEPLPPDGRFVRVHLRPYLAEGRNPGLLLRAFIATAKEAKGDTTQFACAERGLAHLSPEALRRSAVRLFADQRARGFGATHHSAAFESAYAPAYRVIRATSLGGLGIVDTASTRHD